MITSFFKPKDTTKKGRREEKQVVAASSAASSSLATTVDQQGTRTRSVSSPASASASVSSRATAVSTPSSASSASTSSTPRSQDDGRSKRSNPYIKIGTGTGSSSNNNSNNVNNVTVVTKRPKTNVDTDGDDAVTAITSALHDGHRINDDDDDEQPFMKSSSLSPMTWKKALQKHFASPSFTRLAKFVQTERQKYTIYPPVEDVFTALNLTPLSNVKVVIVGQDPYHGPRQAHGLCFSIRRDANVPVPPSLRNIYKELLNDPKVENFNALPSHGCLQRWAEQGVLMINTVMTVRKGEANSHQKRGWEEVTDAILRAVRDRRSVDDEKTPNGVVFLLWGKPATEKTKTILSGASRTGMFGTKGGQGGGGGGGGQPKDQVHKIIATSHPSPLGATKTDSPFLGSRCFSRANDMLIEMGHQPIDWRVDR